MLLNPSKISEILKIIEFQHVLFIGTNIGIDVLTPEDKKLLNKFGIKLDDIRKDFTAYDKQYYFGRLSAALGDKNAQKLSYNDFLKYLRRGQYVPLNKREKESLMLAKQRTYTHLKALEQRVVQTTSGIISQTSLKFRQDFEKVAQKSVERAILERDTISSVVSEIGEKTKDYNRDLGRIAATEMQSIYSEGRSMEIERMAGREALVYKQVYSGVCRYCMSFFTTNGFGSQPRIFKLDELRANGSNIGRKQSDWLPTIPPTHPWCRCELHYIPEGYIWDNNKQMFTAPYVDLNNPNRKRKGIKLIVGDKVFNI